MWIVLFTMTFQRAVTAANADDRHRPAMWMWVAAPAVASLAYNSIRGQINANGALTFDNVSKSFMFMALSLFFCLGKLLILISQSPASVPVVSAWHYSLAASRLVLLSTIRF